MTTSLLQAYSPENFRVLGHQLIDQLSDYLELAQAGGTDYVLPPLSPESLVAEWPANFREPQGTFAQLIGKILAQSNHLHHPRYMGHQVSAPLPMSALCDLVDSLLNNGTSVFEMGPASNAMERALTGWMARKTGYDDKADGLFTSGGSLGNLTALLSARQAKTGYDAWDAGTHEHRYAILVSDEAHYSVKRAVQMMGWGAGGVIPVTTDARFKISRASLEDALSAAKSQGREVLIAVGNACSTATGTFDPLDVMADFCEQHGLWFHVDGAHGAPFLLSETHQTKLTGVSRADSFVWDAHKMMMVPGLLTAVLFKNGDHAYETFAQKASYLFEKDARSEWYNPGHRTVECTRKMMSLKLYACLTLYGEAMFADYIDRVMAVTTQFSEMTKQHADFEIAGVPEANILCFRYAPKNFNGDLDQLQMRIRQQLLDDGQFYIVQTRLKTGFYLRCSIMNPLTTLDDCAALLQRIEALAIITAQT